MFKNHDSGILTLSLFTTFTHISCLARRYFTNARKMSWSCEDKCYYKVKAYYAYMQCVRRKTYIVHCTVYRVHKPHLVCTHILYISKYN